MSWGFSGSSTGGKLHLLSDASLVTRPGSFMATRRSGWVTASADCRG